MNDHDNLRDALTPDVDPEEAEALARIARRLQVQRPVPRAAFRGDLRRWLLAQPGRRPAADTDRGERREWGSAPSADGR
jgi:hypothetical protein